MLKHCDKCVELWVSVVCANPSCVNYDGKCPGELPYCGSSTPAASIQALAALKEMFPIRSRDPEVGACGERWLRGNELSFTCCRVVKHDGAHACYLTWDGVPRAVWEDKHINK